MTRAAVPIVETKSNLAERIRQQPNDPAVLRALHEGLVRSDASLEYIKMLFGVYADPKLSGRSRGYVTLLIANALRRDANLFDPTSIGIDPEAPGYKMVCKGLKHHLDAVFSEFDVAIKFQRGLMTEGNSPKFIVAIPKSGSSLLGLCLGNMISLTRGGSMENNPNAYRGYPKWWRVGRTHDWDLRADIGADPLFQIYPGGVYKGHINPTDANREILRFYKHSRILISIRDPRDQIVALYCQYRRYKPNSVSDATEPEAVRADLLRFMREGHLLDSLTFVGKWLCQRDPERSKVVTFEGLVSDPIAQLSEVVEYYGLNLSSDVIASVYNLSCGLTDRVKGQDRSGHDPSIYPLGWTGAVGVWREYFSPEANAYFDETFDAFRRMGPWADAIAGVYPGLCGAEAGV